MYYHCANTPYEVPVIAIFTKFDDLITQVWDEDRSDEDNRTEAFQVLHERLRDPLFAPTVSFPPKGDVWFEGR
jgi:hypothetical protein